MEKKLSELDIKKVNALLDSDDNSNAEIAVEILQTFGLYSQYLTDALINYYKTYHGVSWDWRAVADTKKRLSQLMTLSLKKRLGSVYDYRGKTGFQMYNYALGAEASTSERRITANIWHLSHDTPIDGDRLAAFVQEHFKRGEGYLLQFGSAAVQRKFLQARLKDKSLDLSGLGLTLLPRELYHFQEIETINLRHNRLKTLPRMLSKLSKLSKVDASFNKIQKVHPDLFKLLNIEKIVVTGNPVNNSID